MDEHSENNILVPQNYSNRPEDYKTLIHSIVNGDIAFSVHGNQQSSENREDLIKDALKGIIADNQKYSALFLTAPAGYVVLNENLKVQEANRMAGLLLGREPDNLKGTGFNDFLENDYQDSFHFFIKNLKAGKTDGCRLKLKNDSGFYDFRGTTGLEKESENQTFRIMFFNLSEGTSSDLHSQLEGDIEYAPDQKPKPGDGILKDLTILVADDDELARIYLGQLLNDKCRKVLFAENGKEAVEIFQNSREIDLILMDIKMPVLDGYSATIKIKEIDKKVIVIAQTAYALASDREKALAAGCNDYLAKPLMKKDLFSVIEKFFK